VNRALCPGTFDPVTCGHLDIIERVAGLYDTVTVAVALNPEKGGGPLFDVDTRVAMLQKAVEHLPNVDVRPFDSLLVKFAEEVGARVVVKGLRAVTDFEREFQMAQLNHRLADRTETLFMMSVPEYAYLSSSAVKEIARHGGAVEGLVPPHVSAALRKRFAEAGKEGF